MWATGEVLKDVDKSSTIVVLPNQEGRKKHAAFHEPSSELRLYIYRLYSAGLTVNARLRKQLDEIWDGGPDLYVMLWKPIFRLSRQIRHEAAAEILRTRYTFTSSHKPLTWFRNIFCKAAEPHIDPA